MDNINVPFSGRCVVGLPIGEHDKNKNDATANTIYNPIKGNIPINSHWSIMFNYPPSQSL